MTLSNNRNWMEFGPRLGYPRPIPSPITDPTDNPQWYIHTSEPFIPWVNGAIKRLIEEETYEGDDDGNRQNAIQYFDELMSSWKIRPNLEIPKGYLKLFGYGGPPAGYLDDYLFNAASEPQQRISTWYSQSIESLGSSVYLQAWDSRSDDVTALNLFDVEIQVPDMPTFPDDDLQVDWRIAEDGEILHSVTIANGRANKSILGMPLFCTLVDIYMETDKYGIWWYLRTGLMPDGN